MPQLTSLLRLPLELRHEIYAYLFPPNPTSHPLPHVGITSVTHTPPTLTHLLVHRQLTAEIQTYYFQLTTWKLIISHAFNFFRVDSNLEGLERSSVLRHLRRVELVFFCDILLLKDYPSFGLEAFSAEIRRRAERACHVLGQARELKEVTVSWIDTTLTGQWEGKAAILMPLKALAADGQVRFRIGEVYGPDEQEEKEEFVASMREVLGEEGEVGSKLGEDCDSKASDLRMLAFDPRQGRDRLASATSTSATSSQSLAASGWRDEGTWRRSGRLEAWQRGPAEVGA
ncbi:hypothetical protein LTR62_002050 [Meristemomyces frigidus]|uniref:F-box domain-containing protein n=1 Tax=Meristemomyces frigidus TaxID=1508187 RepID=A0AAN7TGA9_9PEZI|nr:hypothetical protein LTR62_002050 [Meristemomyces frigidus]